MGHGMVAVAGAGRGEVNADLDQGVAIGLREHDGGVFVIRGALRVAIVLAGPGAGDADDALGFHAREDRSEAGHRAA